MKNSIKTLVLFIATTLIVVWSLSISASCSSASSPQVYNDSVVYTIPTGAHYSTPRLNQSHSGIKKLTYNIQFDYNCKYKLLTIDSNDINKAYGFSYGFHQTNSSRLGWNWKKDTLILYNYTYFSGKITTKRIGLFARNKPIYVEQWYQGRDTSWISCKQNNIVKSIFVTGVGTTPMSGYYLYPYFGGTSVAPNTMTVKVWSIKTY